VSSAGKMVVSRL